MHTRNIGRRMGAVLVAAVFLFAVSALLPVSPADAGGKPSVTVNPSSGVPEAAIEISGTGFRPNEEIDIVLILGEGLRIGLGTAKVEIVAAGPDGSFSASSAIPKMAKPGDYTIEIIGSEGSEASVTLSVTPKQ